MQRLTRFLCAKFPSNREDIRSRKQPWLRVALMVLSCFLLAGPASAQSDQCSLNLSIAPASPVASGQPVTVTVTRNFAAQLKVVAPVSLDGQQFCNYANPFIDPQDNTCPANGTVFNNLTSGDHTVSWTCTVINDPVAGPPLSGSQTFTVAGPPPPTGSINPKFVVLSVIYAPPGQKSSVDYGTSTAIGATTAYDHSTSNTKTISLGLTLGGLLKIDESRSWTQAVDNTSSIAVKKTNTSDIIVPGPANSGDGIDHNYDIILLWLNATVNLTATSSTTVAWMGYGFDTADPANEMDVVPVYVAWLKDPTTMPAGVANALKRTWAAPPEDGSGPGLTPDDFATILARDPFANGSTTIDPARFDLTGQTFSYAPPPNKGQPLTEKFSLAYTTISTQSVAHIDEYIETYSIGGSVASAGVFKGIFSATFKDEHKIDITNSVTQTATQNVGQKATLKLTGPSAGYTGPTDLQVYQDNVYGTFLFAFVSTTAPDFALSATPGSQVAPSGGTATYTVTASPLNGFTGNIDLSATGAPTGCAAVTFNPASISGGSGSSTMTVPACSTPGDFTITVVGTSAGMTDTTTVRLVVSQAPFVLVASPPVQAVTATGTTTYLVSSAQSPSFNGVINLGVSGLPAGASGSFNPTSISGAGTSTLTVNTSSSTPPGDTPSLTITGTSGSLPQATTTVDLIVSGPPGLTGVGCQVVVTLKPGQPVEGQPVTYTATLSGIPPGNNQSLAVNLDSQPLCSNSGAPSCSATQNAPASGTHALQWSCTTDGPGGSGTGSGTQTMPVAQASGIMEDGSIRPKFAVLSVIYAPPGQKSTVDYGSSQLLSATSSIDNTFSDNTAVTVTAGITASIKKVLDIGVSASFSKSWTHTLDTINSIEVDKTNTLDIIVPGPATSADGINHDFDVILVWLNPVLNVTITGINSAQWSGLGFDGRDPANEVDIVPLYVAWLKDPTTMPPDVQAALARTWADPNLDGSGPGLTTDDFKTILARDPFSDPSYVPTLLAGATTTTDHRFDLALGKTLPYEAPSNGGQPITETATLSYDATRTEGLKATDEFAVSFSVQFSADITIPIAQWLDLNFKASVKDARKLDWKNVVSQSAKQDSTQTATLSLTGPSSTYTGPTDIQVFKDNLYGTFMFDFSPTASIPDFSLWAAPDSQTVPPGGSNRYTISALAERGFTGNVTLSASGLPAGLTASFSPNPMTPATPSTMTLSALGSAVPGDYTFTVTGTSGTLGPHSATVNVIVGPATFVLSGSPASRTVLAGQSTTYSVSSQAIAGFSGSVALSASAPAGIATSFVPASISGTASSTLTATVDPSLGPGTYPITITGTSGTLSQSETVNVVVPAAPFVLEVSPPVQAVLVGESPVWTVKSTPLGGFNGIVNLSIDLSPFSGTGASATFGPSSIISTGSSTLTLNTVLNGMRAGHYTLTITGTSGSQQVTTTIDVLLSYPFTQGGTGCSVNFALNPPQPLANQPFSITATLDGLATGNTGQAQIALDYMQLCTATNSSACVVPSQTLSAGTHVFVWNCTSTNTAGDHTKDGTGSATPFFSVGTPGTLNPKYQVLSVIYAPPGQNSSVDYGTSTTLGTSTSLSESFSSQTSLGTTLTAGFKYTIKQFDKAGAALFNFKLAASLTDTFTQALQGDLSFAVSKTESADIVVPGPQNSNAGINHDFDVILLWVNPVANFVITGPNNLQWAGLSFDPNDPAGEMDVVPVYVGWLKNPSLMPPGVAFSLARTWADQPTDGSGTSLTTDDYAKILARDPFANGATTIDQARFGLTGETFAYAAPPNGGEPLTETLALKYEAVTQQTHSVTDTYTVGFSFTSPDATGTPAFLKKVLTGGLSANSTAAETLTLKNVTKQTNTQTADQTAMLTLVGPAAPYTGPTDLQVYQDNVYGTFMFAFVPSTTFQLSTTSPSQSTTAGGSVSYTVSLATVAGFTGPVVLSTSGLPETATATFGPASLSGTGSSTLTVATLSSIPVGIYPFSILGSVTTASGTETHVTSAVLEVVPGTGFSVFASPSAEAIVVGQSSTYLVSTDAATAFNGAVSLSASGTPAGVTVSFNPGSITGIGFATMTVNVASTVQAGNYTFTVTGSSGGVQVSTTVGLTVLEAPSQSGSGCSVGFIFDPSPPPAGQPMSITATLQGLAPGNTGSESVSLDHQQLCGGATSTVCSSNQVLPAGIHALEWSCTSSGPGGSGSASGSQAFTVGPPLSDGNIKPKYAVLSVIYAPPGAKSFVDYGSSTMLGTSASLSSSFSSELKVSLNLPVKVPKFPTECQQGSPLCITASGTFNEKSEDGFSIDVNKTSTFDIQLPGLLSPTDGINHDYDIILLWINPVVNLTITGTNNAQIPGYAFDSNDPANEVDVVPVYVKWLKDAIQDPTTLPPGIADALARRWAEPAADGTGPGLTTADFQAILKRDPFSDPTYVLTVPPGSTTSADNRFDLQAGETFAYEPPPNAGQPLTESFSLKYQATSTKGKTASDEYSVTYGKPVSRIVQNYLVNNLLQANTLTWGHKSTTGSTDSVTQTAKLSLTGPCFGYEGPTDVQVLQDNVYGTFMFAFVNGPTIPDFSLCATPVPGKPNQFTVSASPVAGFNSDVALTISGLPSGVTASFNPGSIPQGAGSSLLTLTIGAAAGGTYQLVITGTGGSVTHTTTITLTVNAVPVFALAATPAKQAVGIGGSTTYAVSSTALNGLTGDVALTVTGLPAGATASFNPSTIVGSTGTSTLTVTTSNATPAADSALTIKGTNKTITQTAPVTLSVGDFTVAAAPATQQVLTGTSATYTVSTTAVNGFNGTVALTVTGLPAGATASFNPATITGTGTSTLTVTTSGTTPANSTLTITGTNGTLAHTATVTLSVVDFTFTVTPASQTVVGGGSANYTVTTTALNGFSGTVTPSVTGLPAGATASFSPATITGAGTSTLTVTTAPSTPGGNSTLSVTGTTGSITKSASVTLALQNFTIAATPATQTLTAGDSTTYSVTFAAVNGFTGTITPSVSGLPAGATASFSPATITGGSGTTTMTLTTAASTPAASSTLTITGTSGTAINSTTVSLTVASAFTVSISPSTQTVTAGGSASYTVTVTPLGGFTGTVTLSISGLPAGAAGSFSPATLAGASGTSTLTVTTTAATPGGNTTLTVTGTSGTVVKTAQATLGVRNFTLTATPATQSVIVGGSVTYTVTATAVNGLTGNLALSVTGLPAGATASFNPSMITGSTGTSTLTVTTSGTTPAANSTLTITGTNGTLAQTATVTLKVLDFNITVTPATQTVASGGATTYTVTTTALNGFSGVITPTVAGLPAGATASFSPASITGAGSSTMTVSTSSTTPAANSTLTVTGTSGPRAKAASGVTLSVTDFTITISPASQTLTAGGGTTYTVTITALNGFTGNVPLSASGLPSGASASFSPGTIAGGGTSTMTINTSGSTAGGTTSFTVTGNSGGTPTHSASATLTVIRPLVILRPTVANPMNSLLSYANPGNAEDGNPSTFASGSPGGAQARGGEIWSGFGAGPSPRTTVNLKITSAGNCVVAQAEGFAVDYSLNGGATWTTIYSMGVFGGSCTIQPQRTDVVSLSAGQDLTQVQVRARFGSFGQTTHQMYDSWIEAQ